MNSLRPRRLGHMVLMVRDIHRSAKFYTEVMGLKVSDWTAPQDPRPPRRRRRKPRRAAAVPVEAEAALAV